MLSDGRRFPVRGMAGDNLANVLHRHENMFGLEGAAQLTSSSYKPVQSLAADRALRVQWSACRQRAATSSKRTSSCPTSCWAPHWHRRTSGTSQRLQWTLHTSACTSCGKALAVLDTDKCIRAARD